MGDERYPLQKDTTPLPRHQDSMDGQLLADNTNTPKKQEQPTQKAPPAPTNVVPVELFPDKDNKDKDKVAAIEVFFADPKNTALSAKKNDPAAVREVQQALIDLKQLAPKDIKKLGTYDKATEKAVENYRKSRSGKSPVVKKGGAFEASDKTLVEDHFRDREAYVEAASGFDKSKPEEGTRPLDSTDKTAIGEVYGKEETAKKAKGTVAADKSKLNKKEKQLYSLFVSTYKVGVNKIFKSYYLNQTQQRKKGEKAEKANPTKENEFLFTKSSIEDIANVAKEVVDSLYKSMASAAPSFKTGVNLFDYWEEQEKKHKTIDDGKGGIKPLSLEEATYFFNNGIKPLVDKDVNLGEDPDKKGENAVTMEKMKKDFSKSLAIPIDKVDAIHQLALDDFLKDKDMIKRMLQAEQGVPGVTEDGKQYLQRFKSTNPDATQKMEEDRLRRWRIFYTSIHEYLHLLKHKDYKTWLNTFKNPKRRILAEGACEFFALNVYAKFPPSALKGAHQEKIEGRKPATAAVPTFREAGRKGYDEHKQAEQLARTVGIHNLQAAYFQGKTDLLDEA